MNKEIEKLLQGKFEEEGFEDCYLVEIKQHKDDKLEIFIDCDSGVNFEKCRKVSRFLESYIEEYELLDRNYTIDVSSPGIDRPLKLLRQYKKNIGRKLEVSLIEQKAKTGKLLEVEEDFIILEEKIKPKTKGKKKVELHQTKISFSDIKKTVVKITW